MAMHTGESHPLLRWPQLLTGVVLLYVGFRLPWLTSIPGYTFDEGLLGLAAKNWVTLGDPLLGGNVDLLRFPLFTSVLAGAFSLLGHSILVARLLSVAFGLASLFVYGSIARRLLGSSAARWAMFLFAVDFILIRYQRYGLLESLQILLILSTVAVWIQPRMRISLLAPVLVAAAILQKPTSMQIIPVLLWLDYSVSRHGWKLLSAKEPPPMRRDLLVSWILATIMVALVHGGLWARWPSHFLEAWGLYVKSSFQLADLPKTFGILALCSPVAMLGVLTFARRPDDWGCPKLRFVLLWLLTASLFLLFYKTHPIRYFSVLLPPALLLGARAMDALASSLTRRGRSHRCPSTKGRQWVSLIVLGMFLYTSVLFGLTYFLRGGRDGSPLAAVRWIKANVPAKATILGAPQLGVDIPNRYLDMASLGSIRLSGDLLRTHDIGYVLFDDAEWRALSTSKNLGVSDSLAAHCILETRVGTIEVWKVRRWRHTGR